jgi:hypothetical protein
MGALPQGGGYFGGYFRGTSACSAAGPGGREDISATSAAALKVTEGRQRVHVFQASTPSPVPPGRLESAGLR